MITSSLADSESPMDSERLAKAILNWHRHNQQSQLPAINPSPHPNLNQHHFYLQQQQQQQHHHHHHYHHQTQHPQPKVTDFSIDAIMGNRLSLELPERQLSNSEHLRSNHHSHHLQQQQSTGAATGSAIDLTWRRSNVSKDPEEVDVVSLVAEEADQSDNLFGQLSFDSALSLTTTTTSFITPTTSTTSIAVSTTTDCSSSTISDTASSATATNGSANASSTKKPRPKKYQCPYCWVALSNTGQFRGHIRIHTGERPFKCDQPFCLKTFTRNEELTRHKRIHTGQRPYGCQLCNKRFGRKDHLKKHTRTHEKHAQKLSEAIISVKGICLC